MAEWLRVWPTSCIRTVVAAAVDPQTRTFSFEDQLGMRDDMFEEKLPAVVAELQQLPTPLQRVTATAISDGRVLADGIACLGHLRCLELSCRAAGGPAVPVPDSMTALTRLSLEIEASPQLTAWDVGMFTTLQV
jgi:hypothetical protein